jgi:hypothetical protein
VYPAPAVTALINEQFLVARVHAKEQPAMWHRYDIRWTPTVIVLSPDGEEVRRIEGFLPVDDFLGALRLALGYLAANAKQWTDAARWFDQAAQLGETDAGPEGMYWRGVARFSASHDHAVLPALRKELEARYPNSGWARRSTVWGP